jgi:chromosome segregation ATPase
MKLRQNARNLQEKQKEELLLDHEIDELKAELSKIESKIEDKKHKFVAGKLRKGVKTIATKQVQEQLKKTTKEIERYKHAYKTLLHSWQDGVINPTPSPHQQPEYHP